MGDSIAELSSPQGNRRELGFDLSGTAAEADSPVSTISARLEGVPDTNVPSTMRNAF